MLFSDYYKIDKWWEKEWFNPILDWDTKLFIDPLLLFHTNIPEFIDSKEKIKKFFQYAFEKVAEIKGKGIERLEEINPILSFKEPREILLGYTLEGSSGRGIGPDFSRKIRDAIIDFIDYGLEDLAQYVGTFTLIVDGIGPDGISDMIANIIKEDLIKYTQRICKEEKIPIKTFLVNNIGCDIELCMWRRDKVDLPQNPLMPMIPVILVPKAFLRTNEIIDITDLEYYLARIDNEELRKQASRLFVKDLDTKKIRLALDQDPITAKKILISFLEYLEKGDLKAYNFEFDSELIYKFELLLKNIKTTLPKKEISKKDKESLKEFVEEVINQYKKIIEKRENYWLLYNEDDKPKAENASQRLFWAIADTMCFMNGVVVVSRENQTGRGPVDFRFNKDYKNKIVVELKHVKSQDLFKGMSNQLLTYIISEESDYGYYVVIKLLPSDTARFYRLLMRFEKMDKKTKEKIIIKDIDARTDNKPSASRV